MMIRTFALLLIAGMFVARASDAISADAKGASATVTQPHETAELIPERTTVAPGQPFDVALHLHSDPGWHTYWINPGDAGLATTIDWTLPPGFTAGPIQWPTPEKHPMGGIMTFGYTGDVYLLTTITPPKDKLPQHFEIKATARWLVCEEECIPGHAELTVPLDSGPMNLRLPQENTGLFAQARERMPGPPAISAVRVFSNVSASYRGDACDIRFKCDVSIPADALTGAVFFPEQSNVLSASDTPMASTGSSKEFSLKIKLQENGEKPDKMSGVLVLGQDLATFGKALRISEFPVAEAPPLQQQPTAAGPAAATLQTVGPDNSLSGSPQATGGSPRTSASSAIPDGGHRPPLQATAAGPAAATLIAVLGAAFIGGLILNLMPCVLPVLSLKVFSLMKHAGENPKAAWRQGAAFTAGVVLSFWILAGLLLILRSAGNHLGWGFQMQSPGFVLGLILLFFLLALNLFGVFELGTSLVGLDAKAAGKLHGLGSSFGNGALATLAATPCTAPFMGSALGFAAQQPPFVSLLIFTALALGMATPYLLLTIFPGALRFVPKPGAWMEAFKQFMGFLLMATVIFLVYVFGALVGEEQLPWLLCVLLLTGLAAWIYGRWCGPIHSAPVRFSAVVVALAVLAYAITWGIGLANTDPSPITSVGAAAGSPNATAGTWQPWSPDAVNQALTQGHPVFVDFTAAWCLSCKVNETVALGTDAVKQAFAQKNVALFRADWTHADPAISQALQQYHRDGVPLYLVYSPKNKDAPQVLPEVLTSGIVLDALNNL